MALTPLLACKGQVSSLSASLTACPSNHEHISDQASVKGQHGITSSRQLNKCKGLIASSWRAARPSLKSRRPRPACSSLPHSTESTQSGSEKAWDPLQHLPSSPLASSSVAPSPSAEVKDSSSHHESTGRPVGDDQWRTPALLSLLLGVPAVVAGFDFEGTGSVVSAAAVLAGIVAFHELGHFSVARFLGIHVTKFAVGFGPTLAKWDSGAVEYSIRAIPLGGYVAFPDDDPQSPYPADDPNLLKNRPIWDRVMVISAGVVANLLLAYTVLLVQVPTVGLVQQLLAPGVAVPGVLPNSAALRSGVKAGDIVLAVNGEELPADPESVQRLVDRIRASPKRDLQLSIVRDKEPMLLTVRPDATSEGAGNLGVQLTVNAEIIHVQARDVVTAVSLASGEYFRLCRTVVEGLSQIFLNFAQTAEKVSGPIAIVAAGAEVARRDAAALFQFGAIVNLNLAAVNLLPIPGLDGGYLLFCLIEALRGGKKLPDRVEQSIMSSGVLLLLGVGMVLIVRDTLNLEVIQRLGP